MAHEPSAATPARTDLEETFARLAAQWKRERGPTSFVTEMIQHPAYGEILALGEAVVPLLLRELEQAPDYWFAALRALTGANPVPLESRGKPVEMARAWVAWGQEWGERRK